MTSRALSLLLVALGAVLVVVAVGLLAGVAWAVGVAGVLLLLGGLFLVDVEPRRPIR